MSRPVHRAMATSRPEKATVRQLWVRQVELASSDREAGGPPLYLTLAGAEGHDIQAIVDAGILRLTEAGGIALEDVGKVVSVESSSTAVLELQSRFPGLKILEQPLADLLRSDRPVTWPVGEDRDRCRAYVVNVDLNSSLTIGEREGQVVFPEIDLIVKVAQLHALEPTIEWTLCLTLNGSLTVNTDHAAAIVDYLAENLESNEDFAVDARMVLGTKLREQVASRTPNLVANVSRAQQQRLLMAFVPKKIADRVVHQGWRTETLENLMYGGQAGSAAMVSWIVRFHWERRAGAQPRAVYGDALATVLRNAGRILTDGRIDRMSRNK